MNKMANDPAADAVAMVFGQHRDIEYGGPQDSVGKCAADANEAIAVEGEYPQQATVEHECRPSLGRISFPAGPIRSSSSMDTRTKLAIKMKLCQSSLVTLDIKDRYHAKATESPDLSANHDLLSLSLPRRSPRILVRHS